MSFRVKITLGVTLIEGVVLLVLMFGGLDLLQSSSETELRDSGQAYARLLAHSVREAVAVDAPATVQSAAKAMLSAPGVVSVRIHGGEALLVEVGDTRDLDRLLHGAVQPGGDGDLISVHAPIFGREGVRGGVDLGLDMGGVRRRYREAHRWSIAAVALLMGLTALFTLLLGGGLKRRLMSLQRAAEAVEHQGPGEGVEIRGNDELARATRAFNRMSAGLKNSWEGLRSALVECKEDAARAAGRQALQSEVLESAPDAVISIDANGTVVGFNAAAERTFGFSRSEARGRPLAELIIPPGQREAHRQGLERYLATGRGEFIGKRLELDAWHRDGHTLPVEMTVIASHTVDGVIFTSLLRDLTEKREAERELRLAAHAFEASEAVLVAGRLGTVLRVNRAFTRITGYPADEIVGKSPALLSSGKQDAESVKSIARKLNKAGSWEGEVAGRHKEGRVFPARLSIGAVRDRAGEITHYVAYFSDITEPKRKEAELEEAYRQAEQASRTKSRFLASISHEIRTPLNAIINMNALLADSELSTEQRQLARVARDSGKGLLGLIDNVLEFSKIEAGQQQAAPRWFDVEELVQGVADLFYPQAREKGIEIACVIHSGMGRRILTDADMVRRILINLVSNAVKFTDRGGVLIRLLIGGERKERSMLRLQVEDTGIGISEQDRERIFQGFVQADDSSTRKFGGVGLGLTISRGLAELLDANITVSAVDQNTGGGALFTVEIPASFGGEPDSGGSVQSVFDLQVLLLGSNPVLGRALREQLEFFDLSLVHIDSLDRLPSAVAPVQGHCLLIVDEIDPVSDSAGIFQDARNLLGNRLHMVRTLEQGADPVEDDTFDGVLRKPVTPGRLLPHLAWSGADGIGEETPSEQAAVSVTSAAGHTPARILVVEDSYPNQLLITKVLEREGYDVELAENGQQALEAAGRTDFDLILMDISMPVLDGLDATRGIRALDGPKSRTPIVALTAHAFPEDREYCLAAGMDDYLSKPVDIPNMVGCIRRWLEGIGERRKKPRESRGGSWNSSPAEASVPDVDEAVLEKLVADTSVKVVAKVLELFLQDARERIPRMESLLQAGESAALRFEAHAMKSAAGSCGALRLQIDFRQLEDAAKAADHETAAAALERVAATWERSEGRLQGYLSRLQQG